MDQKEHDEDLANLFSSAKKNGLPLNEAKNNIQLNLLIS